MDTQFCLIITLKTTRGTENIGRFHLGEDQEKAIAIFRKLKGTTDVSETNMLSIEFREQKKNYRLILR